MREIWDVAQKWHTENKRITLGTVIKVTGSSLRPEGSMMIIADDGAIYGSVTGGCVEGAVFDEAKEVLKSGKPKLLSYGVSNEQAWEVGLSCGGSVEIFVESMESAAWKGISALVEQSIAENQLAALLTVVSGEGAANKMHLTFDGVMHGTLGSPSLDQAAHALVAEMWTMRKAALLELPGGITVFADFILPPPRLLIIGASHIAIPLVALANTLDYHTVVIDPRSAFATRERFPHVDELVLQWPDEALENLKLDTSTCVVCLSHDDKLDNPALLYAMRSPARYIGALGSKVTNANRLVALRQEGATEEELKRIHAPIGLKIGSRAPAEIALSIMAEIVATAHNVVA